MIFALSPNASSGISIFIFSWILTSLYIEEESTLKIKIEKIPIMIIVKSLVFIFYLTVKQRSKGYFVTDWYVSTFLNEIFMYL